MKLNELVCPSCGLKCMTDASYTTCASCQTTFYANQSRSVDYPLPLNPYPGITITPWPWLQPQPNTPYTVWVGDVPPYGSASTGILTTDQTEYQVWN